MRNLLFLLTLCIMTVSAEQPQPPQLETITLGGGCFWCVEAVYDQLDGVESATSGYMGGEVENPTYKQVITGLTGHIEVVQVQFDPAKVTLAEILEWFWQMHNPTTKDRQGNDVGPQYASAIFYESDAQKTVIEKSITQAQEAWDAPIVTHVRAAAPFYTAEGYHQEYYRLNKNKNPYCQYVITPKLKKLKLEY